MKTVLAIAGSDSSGGAGIQADLQAIAAQGLHAATAITAITSQSPRRVFRVSPVSSSSLRDQLSAVSEMSLSGIKTGMLANADLVGVVADFLEEHRSVPCVVDPVLISSSGYALLDSAGLSLFVERVLPQTTVLTPNIPEAEVLLDRSIPDLAHARKAVQDLGQLGVGAVVLKGGHLEGEDVVDLLWDGLDTHHFKRPRVPVGPVHGTGCVHASTLASLLALGVPLVEAVARTQDHLHSGVSQAREVGNAWVVEPHPAADRERLR
jgi:hydroxymethylpyrimidine/phosphomethylpyrimidine kinase